MKLTFKVRSHWVSSLFLIYPRHFRLTLPLHTGPEAGEVRNRGRALGDCTSIIYYFRQNLAAAIAGRSLAVILVARASSSADHVLGPRSQAEDCSRKRRI